MIKSTNDIYMTRPASTYRHRWIDSFPIGNGITGTTVYGGARIERIIINRSDFWYNGYNDTLPDVSYCVPKMRELMENGEYLEACNIMTNELSNAGYKSKNYMMRPLAEVQISFDISRIYYDYKRVLHLDTAEQEISYKLDKYPVNRKYFVSRKRDVTVMKISNEESVDFSLKTVFSRTYEGDCTKCMTWESGNEIAAMENDAEFAKYEAFDDCYIYSSKNEGKYFGIVCKVVSDGDVSVKNNGISVKQAKESLILIKAFSKEDDREKAIKRVVSELNLMPSEYDVLFYENKEIYEKFYNSADIKLYYENEFHSNEYLMNEARNHKPSLELTEKLWRFGRYLFISGTTVGGLPYPLYGVWAPAYDLAFTQHVANENVQCIYWHTCAGGLSELIKPLIDYYCDHMEIHRENARKLYGCNGIMISTYTSPENFIIAPNVNIILHFLGCAGWLSRHFYDYYLYTKDEETFNNKILPFMLETAEFYEDFHYVGKDGKLVLYPACSPENSPSDYRHIPATFPMPTTKNPTVEIGILKDLLIRLLDISKSRPELSKKAKKWQDMLDIIPDYRINEDGAIAEWIDENVHDEYLHRHISHLYPFFPGDEVEHLRPDLKPYFKKAAELRDIRYFAGWSQPHLSAIFARLNDAKKAFWLLESICKVAVWDSFITCNCVFDMGPEGGFESGEFVAPIQHDIILAIVNAVQEMLFFASSKKIKILPACPEEWPKGKSEFHFITGTVSMEWDITKKLCSGVINAIKDTDISVEFPFDKGEKRIVLKAGEIYKF